MPKYDAIWKTLAGRAVSQGGVNAQSFLEMADHVGMGPDEVERRLLQDLDTDGPIFGNFMRALAGASSKTVLTAERQGVTAGTINAKEELRRLVDLSKLDDAIDSADPEALADLEDTVSENLEETFICTLVNTCYRCLPYHGRSMTRAEWQDLGVDPSVMHDGWTSECNCVFVPTTDVESHEELKAPLVRNKIPGTKRTAAGVTQVDLDRAHSTVAKAMDSEEGRRVLRLLGQVNAPEEDTEE